MSAPWGLTVTCPARPPVDRRGHAPVWDERTRKSALELLDAGLSSREVSMRLGGSPSPACVRNWQTGRVPGHRPRKDAMGVEGDTPSWTVFGQFAPSPPSRDVTSRGGN